MWYRNALVNDGLLMGVNEELLTTASDDFEHTVYRHWNARWV